MEKKREIKIIECPRDAMQGIHDFIPTQLKADYINSLLKVGFNTLDFGSFVSPKAIPQLKDTAEVLSKLDLSNTNSKLLSIVANKRGAVDACQFEEINYLGFPFSVSETFQQRNTNSSIEESLSRVEEIQNLCLKNKKELVVYLSMAFGNPYEDKWNEDIVAQWAEKLHVKLDINLLALSDTIGTSNNENITSLFSTLIPEFEKVEFGAHLHTTPDTWEEKIAASIESGCNRFDGAIKGYGGCPMAEDELTGNMPTEKMLSYFQEQNFMTNLNQDSFLDSMKKSSEIFDSFH
ncbi:MAG: hydroxymethylglutaryl-CoA lyase [Flavobacteriales bacterium]|jgi:hydroxymethylglutaryl-CoA lyase|tara:strand:+ start:7719 stop:8594 length:876 start_codon:yes stop_codon:yes gene_type:complete